MEGSRRMTWIIFSALIILVTTVAALAGRNRAPGTDVVARGSGRQALLGSLLRAPSSSGALGLGLALFVVITLVSSYRSVDNGHVGVESEFGQIVGQNGPGAHFIVPWRTLAQVNVQVQRARFHNPSGQEILGVDAFGRIDAASHETQDVFFDVTINWQITASEVQPLLRNVGPDFFTKLVPSRVNQFFKAETVKYEATEATQKRELIREDVAKALAADLVPYGITVISLQIDNIDYNEPFKRAIEDKQVATQRALQAQAQVAVTQAEAAQAVARAKGAADAAIEAARGDAQSTLVRAQAQADANRQLAASLTPALLQSQAIAQASNIKFAIVPQGSNFLLDPSGVLGISNPVPTPAPAPGSR
jgi:regulator of protease activity HflC (stomatin/prohibitin superfamily)